MNTIWNNNSQYEEPEMQFGLKKIKAIINMVLWLGWDIYNCVLWLHLAKHLDNSLAFKFYSVMGKAADGYVGRVRFSCLAEEQTFFFISVSGISLFCFYCFGGLLYSWSRGSTWILQNGCMKEFVELLIFKYSNLLPKNC